MADWQCTVSVSHTPGPCSTCEQTQHAKWMVLLVAGLQTGLFPQLYLQPLSCWCGSRLSTPTSALKLNTLRLYANAMRIL